MSDDDLDLDDENPDVVGILDCGSGENDHKKTDVVGILNCGSGENEEKKPLRRRIS
jgi:hypothetical protein